MNALNTSSTPEVTPALRPLVFSLTKGRYAWVERGFGFVLDTRDSGVWTAVVGELKWQGLVLKPEQVTALVAAFGSPVLP